MIQEMKKSKISKDNLQSALEIVRSKHRDEIGHNDDLFLRRIYDEGLQKYLNRLQAIGFSGKNQVLDAGCGYGQWSLALASLNHSVNSCDISSSRVNFLRDLANEISLTNLDFSYDRIDKLSYGDETFDAIFCYSVIYMSDYSKAIKEFSRVLRPNGTLYVCSNALGWYLYNFDKNHNPADDFVPKKMAAKVLENTINNAFGLGRSEEDGVIVPSVVLSDFLESNGFQILCKGPEGSCGFPQTSFFVPEYMGIEAVYEIIAEKKV